MNLCNSLTGYRDFLSSRAVHPYAGLQTMVRGDQESIRWAKDLIKADLEPLAAMLFRAITSRGVDGALGSYLRWFGLSGQTLNALKKDARDAYYLQFLNLCRAACILAHNGSNDALKNTKAIKCAKCALKDICVKEIAISSASQRCSVYVHEKTRDIDISISFNVSVNHRVLYDRGMFAIQAYSPSSSLYTTIGEPEAIAFSTAIERTKALFKGRSADFMHATLPAQQALLIEFIRPRRGESHADYVMRANAILAEVKKSLEEHKEDGVSEEESLRMLFTKIGQTDMLASVYAGDVYAMAEDFFPGTTPKFIIARYLIPVKDSRSSISYADVIKASKVVAEEIAPATTT